MVNLRGEELSDYHDVSITELRITRGETFKGLERFINLTILSCDNTNITEFPNGSLVNLTTLSCYNTNITEFPNGSLVNLTTLSCYNTNISEIPSELVNLTDLNCHDTNVTKIPSELKNLTELWCYNTNITEIPNGLVNLTEIYCFNTKITEIPNDLLVKLYYKTATDEWLKENKYRIQFLKLKKKLILNNTLSEFPNELNNLIKTNKYYENLEKQGIGNDFLKIKRLNLDLPKELLNK
jgi:Leucine-rich repeat (LRR) protein